ncbi:MAG: hypothetical protein QOI57_2758 [Rubrobacteraceae bacterium]|jgi:hypothetical protein|nr:hypothetical protein [Rubrobacteraceae bacterium]
MKKISHLCMTQITHVSVIQMDHARLGNIGVFIRTVVC